MSKWQGSAPSNIAIIKYMGKKGSMDDPNQPVNPSLSYTLDHLRTFVELELRSDIQEDQWQPHPQYGTYPLKNKKQTKFLAHFEFLKKTFEIADKFFILRSGNNFPADCGIASSASSFAALTRCCVAAFEDLRKEQGQAPLNLSLQQVADLSRRGSGSSCRSLFPGWVEWAGESVRTIDSSLGKIHHLVVVVSDETKEIGSSLAHQRVATSLLMAGRDERATLRFNEFKKQLSSDSPNWKDMFEIAHAETWDMHALFETSQPSFGYMTKHSFRALRKARRSWEMKNDGPLVTMDAGPNVHFLFREDQIELAQKFKNLFSGHFLVIASPELE
ncbi:MAG: diphosphomevalonate decarboxylase [Bdellovibrionales bacterium]|nr:diphosphomevalonate decarboxylase [Bdellovibrionales bacterium]